MTAYKGDTPPKQRAGYYYVIKSFVNWMLLVFAANFAAEFMLGFVYALATGQRKPPSVEWMYLLGLVVTPLVLLIATYRRTGFDMALLGFNQIKRKWLLVILSIAVLIHLPVLILVIKALSIKTPILPNVRIVAHGNLWLEIPMLVLMIAVVPVAEEFLYRGWLWTDLSSLLKNPFPAIGWA